MNSLKGNIGKITIFAAILLVVGCFSLPIGYYTFLRIAVCVISILAIVVNHKNGFDWVNILLGIIAIIFNPIIPIYLHNKDIWIVIDAISALWMAAVTFLISKK